jgi:hypothetical protein
MRVIAQRSPTVFLLTADSEDPPTHVQVLDLALGRLYPPYPAAEVFKTGDWEKFKFGKTPDAEAMLVGIERMPDVPTPQGFNFTPTA